jgi:hypothetical protein
VIAMPVSSSTNTFVEQIKTQVKYLKSDAYEYTTLDVYLAGISEPWPFGPEDEFDFESEGLMVVRDGPTEHNGNQSVPEHVFPLQHIVATELAVDEEGDDDEEDDEGDD